MPVEPTGEFSIPLAQLQTLLSESATWQSMTGADDAVEALRFIGFFTPDYLGVERPFAWIEQAEPTPWTGATMKVFNGGGFIGNGSLVLRMEVGFDKHAIEQPLKEQYMTEGFDELRAYRRAEGMAMRDSFLTLLNQLGAIAEEIIAAAVNRWEIAYIRHTGGPWVTMREEGETDPTGYYLVAALSFDYGLQESNG
jgi:hypothetical protein